MRNLLKVVIAIWIVSAAIITSIYMISNHNNIPQQTPAHETEAEHKYYSSIGSYDIDKYGRAVIKIGPVHDEYLYVRLRKLVNRLVEKKGMKTIVLDLNSPGGLSDTASIISIYLDLLQEKGITVITYVGPNNQCHSACTVLFSHGSQRIASKSAIFGFHYGTAGDTGLPGKAAWQFSQLEKYHSNLIVYRRIFKLCGTDNHISKLVMDTKNNIEFYKTSGIQRVCPAYVTETVD